MHSPNEIVDLGDIEAAALLFAGFARRITGEMDFVPR
jgi:acetylornithine deacetylase/succinyl-diaminopimelate desuccinylase-like protein